VFVTYITKENSLRRWDTATKRFVDTDDRSPNSLDDIEIPGNVLYSGEKYLDDWVNKTGE